MTAIALKRKSWMKLLPSGVLFGKDLLTMASDAGLVGIKTHQAGFGRGRMGAVAM
jgi:hypothetical protein